MNFSRYLARRLGYSVFVLIGLSIVIFLIARMVPGDPARAALGPRATEEAVQALREKLHLDKPIYVQYVYWLKSVLQGDFGESLFTRRPVIEDVKEFLPATLELALFAGLFMAVFGILLGILAARYSNTWVDNLIRVFSYLGIATPAFVVAIILMLVLGMRYEIFPTIGRLSSWVEAPPRITGLITLDSLITGNFAAFFDALKHLFLPAVSLSLGGMFQEARITRSSMLENMKKDYIAAMQAYGVPKRVVMSKYLLKPSVIPTVSILGLDFASLIGNAFLVELLFNWPGLSRYGINVMLRKDVEAIVAVIMILGIVFTVVNILVDLIVAYLDPRIRLVERGE
ncbi:ABC transporter permease [Thermatribacter velox]|jgi:peptide/nickel transport system permease protein|uniref:ABC transporter permease n=1 Tax=Thermatribacter velox TaxID=3039681 RepID=A0ABZ2YBI4_9BACT